MAAGGGVSERGSPPERSRRTPVTLPRLLRAPPHDTGGAEQGQAVRYTRVREPDEGLARLQHLARGRRCAAAAGGTPPPYSTVNSRRWPRGDCMVRASRRVLPAARLLPCRGLLAPADSWWRWWRSWDALGSAPPPRTRSPFAHLCLALNGARRRRWRPRQSHGRGLTGLSCPAWSPASKARREAPPRPRPLALGLGWWDAPPRPPRVPAYCPARLASPPGALRPRPERAAEECRPIDDREVMEAERMLITPS